MGGETLKPSEFPRVIRHLADGQEHLYDMVETAEEIIWLVEETVSQTSSYEDSQEAVDEERVEKLIFYMCLFVKFLYYKVRQNESYQPAKRIPSDGEEGYLVGVPRNI
jgi:hypothetical protein